MKKTLLVLIIFSISLSSFSQFTLAINEVEVVDGAVFAYNTIGEDVQLDFVVTNTNDAEDIKVGMTVQSITNNASGTNLQFCWDLCYDPIVVGNQYPTNGATLAAGASTSPFGNHFLNNHTGDDPNIPVTYELMFHEIDEEGNVSGTPITITYIYNATLAVEETNQVAYSLYPTVVSTSFTLDVQDQTRVVLLSTTGDKVMDSMVAPGNNMIDVSSLAPQLYYVVLSNSKGEQSLSKIIIK